MRGARRALFFALCLCTAGAAAQAPSAVSLELTPRTPVKGRDQVATLEITLVGAAQPAPPVLRANVGSISDVEALGQGRFRARYTLPATRFPEVAIIVAFAPWPHPQSPEGAFGVLRVPLATSLELPGRAEPGAGVTITLGGQTFGPVQAGNDGSFRLPVVVPPGFGVAKTTITDRARNKRTVPLDLMLPPTDQLACVVTPTRLPADGASRARILCASSDRYGGETKGAKVVWQKGRGTISAPTELGNGVQEWRWTAPRELGSGQEKMIATWKQGAVDSREEIAVELSQGPVRQLEAQTDESVAHVGGRAQLLATTRDGLGRPLPGVRVRAGGEAAWSDDAGVARLSWAPPEAQGPLQLELTAAGPLGREPAELHAWPIADGGVGVAVTDLAGLPIPAQTILVDGRDTQTDDEGFARLALAPGEHQLRHRQWPGIGLALSVDAQGVPRSAGTRPSVATILPLVVAPPVPVTVRVLPDRGAVTWWVESPAGELLPGRAVELRDGNGARAATSAERTKVAVQAGLVTVTDLATRTTAVVEVSP